MKNHVEVEEIGPRFYGANIKDKKHWDGRETFTDATGSVWVNIDFFDREHDEYTKGGGEQISSNLAEYFINKGYESGKYLNGHVNGNLPKSAEIFSARQTKWKTPATRISDMSNIDPILK